jgi:hypothetical protein
VSRLVTGLAGLALALVVAEVVLPVGGHLPPGTFAAFGFVGCVAIVVVSKWLGKRALQRPDGDT